jgi:cell division septum initiation protein DivIVA
MVAHDDKFRVLRKLPEVRFEEELRGYSKGQVDRVLQSLAPLADDVAALQHRLAEAESRAAAAEARLVEQAQSGRGAAVADEPVAPPSFDETLSKTLLLAQRTADQTVASAQAEAAALLEAARREAGALRAETDAARRTALDAVAGERRDLLATAHAEIQERVAEAEASLAAAEGAERARLLDDIRDLSVTRDQLSAEIESLEGHLAQRREVIRAALADIGSIVDDPVRFHSEMPPVASAEVLDDRADTPIVLDVEGLDDLAPASERTEPATPLAATSASSTVLGEFDDDRSGPPTEAIEAVAPSVDDAFDDWSVEPTEVADAQVPAPEVGDRSDPSDESTIGEAASFGFDDLDPVDADPGRLDLGRPAWADAVPDADDLAVGRSSDDPFLDELRRATSETAETDAALERFLSDNPDDDRRSGWFSRRR